MEPARGAKWLQTYGPAGVQCSGAASASHYVLSESVVPGLFLGVCFDNARRHGSGDIQVHCTYHAGEQWLRLDISSKVCPSPTGAANQLEQAGRKGGDLSTGLGLQDLADLCNLRSIPFTSKLLNDGRWHSVIDLKAELVIEHGGESKSAETKGAATQRDPDRIVLVDDQRLILMVDAFA